MYFYPFAIKTTTELQYFYSFSTFDFTTEEVKMATSYFVKVYYTKKSEQQAEIRRFAVSEFFFDECFHWNFSPLMFRSIFHRKMIRIEICAAKSRLINRIFNFTDFFFNILTKKMNELHSVRMKNFEWRCK